MELKKLNLLLITLLTGLLAGSLAYATPGVTTSGVNVRSGPNSKIITGVPRGTAIEILGRKGSWSYVQLGNGRKGWIFSKYIQRGTYKLASRNKSTEGSAAACQDCLDKSVAEPIREASEGIAAAAYAGQGPQCIGNKLIAAAKSVVKNKYGNRSKGKGACALAVRQALNTSKIWPGGGIGHAKDMVPGLKSMGFVNIKVAGMTPENAPAGSILVYGGAKKGAKGCRGLGATYGHVEIKEGANSFFYDARVTRNIQKAFGSDCRPLIGVMQMGSDCKTCSKDLKRTCGV